MKRFFLILSFFTFSLVIHENSIATTLLKGGMATPHGLVIGDNLFFSGTTDSESISIYWVPVNKVLQYEPSESEQLSKSVRLHHKYNPRNEILKRFGNKHRYCGIAGPDLSMLPNGDILMAFSALFKADAGDSKCLEIDFSNIEITVFNVTITPPYQSNNFGPPIWPSYPHVGIQGSTSKDPSTWNRDSIRLDLPVFQDGIDAWASYTWFGGPKGSCAGTNYTSTFHLSKNIVINNTVPDCTNDEGVTEAPAIFKRGPWYYFIYSKNWYNSKYQMYYKKASSVQGLNTSAASYPLTFNSCETRPSNSSQDIGYNAGHGNVVSTNGQYYLLYEYSHGNVFNSINGLYEPDNRDSYIDKLSFDQNGFINQIPAPSFVGGGSHTGRGVCN